MEQSMWGVTSQPLLRLDRIWREIRQDDRVHEVLPLDVQHKKKLFL